MAAEKPLLHPVFALFLESCNDFETRRGGFTLYHLWMGPSLEAIQERVASTMPPSRNISLPTLLERSWQEVSAAIKRDGGQPALTRGLWKYNIYHGESAVLLYSTRNNVF